MNDWFKGFGGAVTVCDTEGIVLYLNDKAAKIFADHGGAGLIGQSLLECHPEPAKTKLLGLLKSQGNNVYTIEKQGVKKLIYQAPWFQDGQYGGLVELSLEVPMEMPHFIRQ
jgi:transcriptional regulator with PAS, ATPase and Fis domain